MTPPARTMMMGIMPRIYLRKACSLTALLAWLFLVCYTSHIK
jgi:hypothetical protein